MLLPMDPLSESEIHHDPIYIQSKAFLQTILNNPSNGVSDFILLPQMGPTGVQPTICSILVARCYKLDKKTQNQDLIGYSRAFPLNF